MSANSTRKYHLAQGWDKYIQDYGLSRQEIGRIAVYVAKDKDSGQMVKITSWQVIIDEETKTQLFNETEALCTSCSDLPDDDFERPLWYWSKDQSFFIVSDHNPQYKSLNRNKNSASSNHNGATELDKIEMVHLACFLIDAIHAMHKLDIYHRIISPSAILMVDSDDQQNAAKKSESRYAFKLTNIVPTTVLKSKGSATLPPPETQFSKSYGKVEIPASTKDIWSMGVTLLELAIGFQASDINKKTLNKFLRGQAALESEVLSEMPMEKKLLWVMQNPWIRELILRCLTVKVSERADAAELANGSTFRAIRELLPCLHSSLSSSFSLPLQPVVSKDIEVFDVDLWQDLSHDEYSNSNNSNNSSNGKKPQQRRALAGIESYLREFGGLDNFATVSADDTGEVVGRGNTELSAPSPAAEQEMVQKSHEDEEAEEMNTAPPKDAELQTEQAGLDIYKDNTATPEDGTRSDQPETDAEQEQVAADNKASIDYGDNSLQMMQQEDQDAPQQADINDESAMKKEDTAFISPRYFNKELVQAEEIKRSKRPRSILKSTTNPNMHEEMEKLRSNSLTDNSSHELVRRVRSREPTNDDGLNVLFLNDIRPLRRMLDKGKLPNDYEGFWEALKHANNNWRRFPRVKGMIIHPEDEEKGVIYTNVMGLKEDNYLRYQQGVDYFCGSKQFLDFVVVQCRLKGNEECLVEFVEEIRAKVSNGEINDAASNSSSNSWRKKRRRSI